MRPQICFVTETCEVPQHDHETSVLGLSLTDHQQNCVSCGIYNTRFILPGQLQLRTDLRQGVRNQNIAFGHQREENGFF